MDAILKSDYEEKRSVRAFENIQSVHMWVTCIFTHCWLDIELKQHNPFNRNLWRV